MLYLIQQVVNTTATSIGSFTFPVPTENIEIFWTLAGIQFAYSFGSQLDQDITAGDWFKGLKGWRQGLVKRVLDVTHHWIYGGILWLYADKIAVLIKHPSWNIPILFFGFGILIDDIRDVENLKRRYKRTPPT
jgi:hypothetical protein